MEAPIDLYYFPPSPPSRAVLMLARALGVDLNLKVVNLMAGEQMQPEFLKLNPMHTVPTMDDNGFVLWESRAILQYLIDQYGKDDSLYPKEPKQAAVISQRLFFDCGTLFPRLIEYMAPVMMRGEQPNNEKKAKLEEALGVFDALLENNKWAAGDQMTVADFAIIPVVSTSEAVQIDMTQYSNIPTWIGRCRRQMAPFGYEDINQKIVDMMSAGFKSKLED